MVCRSGPTCQAHQPRSCRTRSIMALNTDIPDCLGFRLRHSHSVMPFTAFGRHDDRVACLPCTACAFTSLVTEAVMLPTTSSSSTSSTVLLSSSSTGLRADDSAQPAQLQVAMAVAKSGLLPQLESRLLLLLDLWDMDWQQHLQGNTGSQVGY